MCQYFLVFIGFRGDTVCVGVARVGTDSQTICHAPLRDMVTMDIGGPLQSLVITGKLHPLEERMLSVVSREQSHQTNTSLPEQQ